MKVNIPDPCNENWAEMSPTQRGAFCQKCAVDVIDFSNKNAQEIKETLKANIGKHMCGRFTNTQLADLSHSYQVWENQSTRTFQSKFLWACMLAFGMTLFTGCENSIAQNENINIDQISLAIEDSTKTDSIISTTTTIPDITGEDDFIQGDIDISEPEPDPEIMWLGEPVIEFEDLEDVELPICNTTTQDSAVSNLPGIPPNKNHFIIGKIAPPPRFNDFLADTVKIETIPKSIEAETIKAMVYPNPTTGISKLNVKINVPEYYTIDLYNFQGDKISTIFSGNLDQSTQTFDLDLSHYSSGIYLVKITSNYVAHALKINKVN